MADSYVEERNSMEDAFDTSKVPATIPSGPQQMIIESDIKGAQRVAVNRTKGKVLNELKALAAAAGENFYYRWPVKDKNGKTEWIEGPSVKCTNAVAREYGNCFVQVQAIDQGQHWMINARFLDLETGYALERPFQQRKGQNIGGKMDKDRALDLVFQIGVSKATRNVVNNALSEFVDYTWQLAKEAIVTKVGKNIENYRGKANERLQQLGVNVDRVEALIGKPIDKWLAPDIARVIAEIQSINDGMADPDEMWPRKEAGTARPTEDAVAPKDVNADRQQADQAKPADDPKPAAAKTVAQKETAKAPAAEKTAPAEEDAVTRQVSRAIELAAEAKDLAELNKLDDQVCEVTDREKREDQRSRWNEAYIVRKNEIRSGHKGPSALAPKSDATVQFEDWLKEMYAELEKCTGVEDVDALQEKVGNELGGDQGLLDAWTNACNSKARALMSGRKGR